MDRRELSPDQAHLMWLSLLAARACRSAGISDWTRSLAEDLPAAELYFEVFVAPLMREHADAVNEAIASEVLSEWLAKGGGLGPAEDGADDSGDDAAGGGAGGPQSP